MVGKPTFGHRTGTNLDAFRDEMMQKWHFTKEEAAKLTEDRWSYAAYPILVEGAAKAGAVVYADSSERSAFKKAHMQRRFMHWCAGFAEFLRTTQQEQKGV